MRDHRYRSGVWIVALTLIVLLFYWKIAFTKQFTILSQWEMVSQYYTWDTYAAKNIQQGVLPLWDPYRYGGTPFTGEMQTDLFYPFKLALYLAPLDRNGLLSERAFNLYYIFCHWLAAFCMYLLVRRLKLGNLAALVAGVCFGLGGFVQWTAWLNILDAMPWLPLIVLFILRAHEADEAFGRFLNASAAGLALGMTWLAGSVHIAFMDSIVAATLVGYLWLSGAGKRSLRWAAAVLGAILCTSVLFGALQLFPSLEYAPQAYRWVGGDSPIRPFERIPYPVLASTAFGPQSVFGLIFGEVDAGYSDWTPYFGVLPLILTIIGMYHYWDRRLVRYLAALAALSFVYTWGGYSLLHGVLYLAPMLDMAREADRFIYLTQFSMAVLAAFGIQFLFVDRKPGEGLAMPALVSVLKWGVIGLGAILAAASLRLPIPATEATYLSLLFLAGAYGLLAFLQRARTTSGAQWIAVFLIVWDLYSFNWMIQAKADTQRTNKDALVNLIHDRKLADFVKSQPGLPRVHFDVPSDPPNIGNAYGAPVTYAMSASLLMDYSAGYASARQNELLGVRYTARRKGSEAASAPVYSDDVWDVYEDPNALPRAWIVHNVEVDPSNKRPLAQVADPGFDLRHTAVIDRPLETPLNASAPDAGDLVQWLSYGPNTLDLEVTTAAPGLVVLGEVYYPGWTARVDGSPAPIYRTDGLIRGAPVSPGTHRVTLHYAPASVFWAAIVTALALAGIAAASVIYRIRGRSMHNPAAAAAARAGV